MTNMTFGSAPGGDGRSALVGYLVGKNKKGSDGLSARDQMAVNDRKYAQEMEKMAFGHVYSEKAADAAAGRTSADKEADWRRSSETSKVDARRQAAADRRKHKQAKDMTSHTEAEKRTSAAEASQHKKDQMTHGLNIINAGSENKRLTSMNATSGQATFGGPTRAARKGPNTSAKSTQFSGVGEPPATPLDHLG